MLQEFLDLIESKCPGAKPLLIVMRGSQAYGTALPKSVDPSLVSEIILQVRKSFYGLG